MSQRVEYIPPAISAADDGPFRVPRHLIHLREQLARMGGYFWLPCPRCGYDFAGFEAGCESEPTGLAHVREMCCRWCDEVEASPDRDRLRALNTKPGHRLSTPTHGSAT